LRRPLPQSTEMPRPQLPPILRSRRQDFDPLTTWPFSWGPKISAGRRLRVTGATRLLRGWASEAEKEGAIGGDGLVIASLSVSVPASQAPGLLPLFEDRRGCESEWRAKHWTGNHKAQTGRIALNVANFAWLSEAAEKPGVWQRLSKWRDSYTSAPVAKAAKVRKL